MSARRAALALALISATACAPPATQHARHAAPVAALPVGPALPVDPVLSATERLLARRAVVDLVALEPAAREESIFAALYNELAHPKPVGLTEAEYGAALSARNERARDEPVWHVRWGRGGTADLSADATRFYFDVVPAFAGTLADALTAELDRRDVARYSFKVVRALEHVDIPVAAVLYVEGSDLEAGREAALAFARAHPDALWPEEAPFTLRLAPGLSVADEIGTAGPPGVSGNSFGGAMAHLLARALEGAAADLDARGLAARMRTELRRAGFDESAPWRRPSIERAR